MIYCLWSKQTQILNSCLIIPGSWHSYVTRCRWKLGVGFQTFTGCWSASSVPCHHGIHRASPSVILSPHWPSYWNGLNSFSSDQVDRKILFHPVGPQHTLLLAPSGHLAPGEVDSKLKPEISSSAPKLVNRNGLSLSFIHSRIQLNTVFQTHQGSGHSLCFFKRAWTPEDSTQGMVSVNGKKRRKRMRLFWTLLHYSR